MVSCQLLRDKDIVNEHYFQLLIYNHILNTIKQHSLYICTGEFLEGGRECNLQLLILHRELQGRKVRTGGRDHQMWNWAHRRYSTYVNGNWSSSKRGHKYRRVLRASLHKSLYQ